MNENRLAIGIEIGGTKTQVGIGTAQAGLLPGGLVRRHVRRELGAEGILRDVLEMVSEVLSQSGHTLAEVERVGIGYGGLLDTARGVTLKSYQIDGWTDFPLKAWGEAQWAKPVTVENDASTAGLAEARLGSGCGVTRLFYMTIGSGIGGGWIVNGQIDGGQGLGAAEIGHMWVPDPQSGAPMELEEICSGWGLAARAQRAVADTDSSLLTLAGSVERIDARIVHAAALQGDDLARRLLHETCETLGVAISNVAALLHPQRIVIGGGISLMGSLFWDDLRNEFQRRVMPTFASSVEIIPATLGETVVVVGGLCLG